MKKSRMCIQGGTYGGSILGCAAANATIDAIEEDGMLQNATERGVQLVKVQYRVSHFPRVTALIRKHM